MKRKALVLVDWVDSGSYGKWSTEIHNIPITCQTVGWVMAKNKKAVTIVATRGKNPTQHTGDMTIPMGAVKRIRELKS